HRAVTEAEFDQQDARGAFFLSWGAHGNRYALPADIASALAQDRVVVVNVSRTVIEKACRLCDTVRVVNVTAGPGVLRERLLARGRENTGDVESRITRSAAVSLPACAPIDTLQNEGPLAVSIARLVELLRGYTQSGQRDASRNRAPAAG
ncbi:MAG: hypothetical protein MI861_00100, partial [Pirellulales bacterium]|nr:hypothetical protein [Pirellulales bacterium]